MRNRIAEGCVVAALLCLSFHFVNERIHCPAQPAGDEGSWMSAAAELSRGHGFSTNWLEHAFLVPATLPRPDDYRYPALVTILASAFFLFGVSYIVALWTVGLLFVTFEALFYLVVRRVFGPQASVLSLVVFVTSLHQLQWNTIVSTEALFGVVLCLVVALTTRPLGRRRDWFVLGMLCGLLYLVRPNGILFLGAGAVTYLRMRGSRKYPRLGFLAFCAGMLVVMAPWLVRCALAFGNPIHVAGSAGLLRTSDAEPLTLTPWQFVRAHGLWYPVRASMWGLWHFVVQLHSFEHGLELVPLAGVAAGIVRKKPFYTPFTAASFALTLAACAYVSYSSWAGLRYFSAFLPFVYAYGIACLVDCAPRIFKNPSPVMRWGAVCASACLLAMPVFHPHRFYERKYAAPCTQCFSATHHCDLLDKELGAQGSYFAARMAQWNFAAAGHACVGVQDMFDSSAAAWAMRTFSPTLAVFSGRELDNLEVRSLITSLAKNGDTLVAAAEYCDIDYFRIIKKIR
jgi:hypothetical protein